MKLSQLKGKVYDSWEFLSTYRNCLLQPELFKAEVRGFGDLRCKETWVKALARFEALNASHDCLDASSLLLYTLNFKRDRWDYEYRHQIFQEFLGIPGALELMKLGLEQLGSEPFTEEDRRQASGFFEVAREQFRRFGYSIGSIWQLPETQAK